MADRPMIARVAGGLAEEQLADDSSGLVEAIEAREIVECSLARLAAERRSEGDLQRLRSSLAGMAAFVDDPQAFGHYDFELHRALWDAARSGPLSGTLCGLRQPVRELIAFYAETALAPVDRRLLVGHHADLVDAVERQEGDEAAAIICAMMERLRLATALLVTPSARTRAPGHHPTEGENGP